MNLGLLKRPTAFIPIAMSVTALSIVLGYAVMFGVARQADEGTAAHIWQLLMAGQLPMIAFFVFKWFRAQPKQASRSSRRDVSGVVVSLVAPSWTRDEVLHLARQSSGPATATRW